VAVLFLAILTVNVKQVSNFAVKVNLKPNFSNHNLIVIVLFLLSPGQVYLYTRTVHKVPTRVPAQTQRIREGC
jgi:hypothetical protein